MWPELLSAQTWKSATGPVPRVCFSLIQPSTSAILDWSVILLAQTESVKGYTQHTHMQYTCDEKDMVSEIAQCHFPVHYLLDGSVRRGMNHRSVCLCVRACTSVSVTLWLLMKWENVSSHLFVYIQYSVSTCLFCYTDVTSTRPHVKRMLHALLRSHSMRRINTQGHIVNWAKTFLFKIKSTTNN